MIDDGEIKAYIISSRITISNLQGIVGVLKTKIEKAEERIKLLEQSNKTQ